MSGSQLLASEIARNEVMNSIAPIFFWRRCTPLPAAERYRGARLPQLLSGALVRLGKSAFPCSQTPAIEDLLYGEPGEVPSLAVVKRSRR